MQDSHLKVKQKITGALVHGLGYLLFRTLPWVPTGANLFLTIFMVIWNVLNFAICKVCHVLCMYVCSQCGDKSTVCFILYSSYLFKLTGLPTMSTSPIYIFLCGFCYCYTTWATRYGMCIYAVSSLATPTMTST